MNIAVTANEERVDASDLARFVAQCFEKVGLPQSDALTVAELMVEADLIGQETHGVFRLPQYITRLKQGGTNAKARPYVVQETAATALIDGDAGLGHLAMSLATEVAIRKAREAGIGWVGVRNSNHAGPAALYVRPQARQGMIGICMAVGSSNHVPPYGGTDLLLGTNPIAVSVPAGTQDPFVLDMATTVAAMGKIKTLAQRGEPMPEGWMVGRDGQPLTDPRRHSEGFLLPIGGPKGYGLAFAIGLLAGTLNGAAFGPDVVDFTADKKASTNTGQAVAAISVSAFIEPNQFGRKVDEAFDAMRASEPLPSHDKVRVPGENREQVREERLAHGLPIHPSLMKELNALADSLGVDRPGMPAV